MSSLVPQAATGPNEGTCKVGDRHGQPSELQRPLSVASRGCGCSRSGGGAGGVCCCHESSGSQTTLDRGRKLIQVGHICGKGRMENSSET